MDAFRARGMSEGSDEDRQRSRAAGFDDHLTKPADPSTLQELLGASA